MLIDDACPHDRATALLLGFRFYRGGPCSICGRDYRYSATRACVACVRSQGRAHKTANAHREKERKRAWRAAHADQVRTDRREWYRAKRAPAKARRMAEWEARAAARLDQQLDRLIAEGLANAARPAKTRMRWRHRRSIRRARERNAGGRFTIAQAQIILAAQDGQCAYCVETEGLQIDHMHALSRGGSNRASNIQWLCQFHNYQKRTRDDSTYRRLIGITERNSLTDFIRLIFAVTGN